MSATALHHLGKVTSEEIAQNFDRIVGFYSRHKHTEHTAGDLIDAPELIEFLEKKFDEKKLNVNNVLEVGCGTGWLTKKILKSKLPIKKMIALDVSDKLLAVAKKDLKEFNHIVKLQNKSISLYKSSSLYDLVVSANAIDCIADTESSLKNIYKLLKKDGVFAFFIRHPLRNAEFATGKISEDFEEGFYEESWAGTGKKKVLRRYLKIESWKKIIESAGFKLSFNTFWTPKLSPQLKLTYPKYFRLYTRRPGVLIVYLRK